MTAYRSTIIVQAVQWVGNVDEITAILPTGWRAIAANANLRLIFGGSAMIVARDDYVVISPEGVAMTLNVLDPETFASRYEPA